MGTTDFDLLEFNGFTGKGMGAVASALAVQGVGGLVPVPQKGAYLGLVATGPMAMAGINTTSKQMQFCTPMIAMDDITSLQVMFPNYYINTAGVEVGSGGPATINAGIEYPAGVFTRVTFGGGVSGTIPDASQLLSDPVAVSIPRGALFWVDGLFASTIGILYSYGNANPYLRARQALATSGLADPSLTGNVPLTSVSAQTYAPVAVIGQTTRGSVLLIGDSRPGGSVAVLDYPTGDQACQGLGRLIGHRRALSNMGRGGITLANSLASSTNRVALSAYASDIWLQLGVNDLPGASNAAAIVTNLIAYRAILPAAKPVWCSTYEPYMVTSTDLWATVANQTVGGNESKRLALNTAVLAVPSGFAGCLDVCQAVESGGTNQSGKWIPNITADGTHCMRAGYIIQRDACLVEQLMRT